MTLKTSTALTLFLGMILGCTADREFPTVKKLTEFKQTDFLLTLEHEISADRNSIYCVTFLYAWNEVKRAINTPLQFDSSSKDLTLINSSKKYLGVLKAGEYSSVGQVDDQLITAKAEFTKSLPFELKLTRFDHELTFDNVNVPSFGVLGYQYEKVRIINIVYYKDDNNFIIRILTKDNEHEILLLKTEEKFKTMAEFVSEIDSKSELGKIERKNERLNWKYSFTEDDEVVIPKFGFNIETNYATLEGSIFHANNKELTIETAWQRTAFILDEKGAEIEGEAEIAVATDADENAAPTRKPKRMKFDTPFFLMLKRIESKNPYFALWTANTELMTKE